MLRQVRRRLSFANVVSVIALFIALGGTAYAVDGSLPGQNTVGSKDIINGEVKTADLQAPEAWHKVAPGPTTSNRCSDPSAVAVFCTDFSNGPVGDPWYPWHNYGAGWPTAAFYKDRTGIVRFKGLVQNNYTNADSNPLSRPIFRLPAGYRPVTQRVFAIVGSAGGGQEVAAGRVDVQSDGQVLLVQDCANSNCSALGTYVTLDGITFRPNG